MTETDNTPPERPGLAQARDMLAEAERLLRAEGAHHYARRVRNNRELVERMIEDMRA